MDLHHSPRVPKGRHPSICNKINAPFNFKEIDTKAQAGGAFLQPVAPVMPRRSTHQPHLSQLAKTPTDHELISLSQKKIALEHAGTR